MNMNVRIIGSQPQLNDICHRMLRLGYDVMCIDTRLVDVTGIEDIYEVQEAAGELTEENGGCLFVTWFDRQNPMVVVQREAYIDGVCEDDVDVALARCDLDIDDDIIWNFFNPIPE